MSPRWTWVLFLLVLLLAVLLPQMALARPDESTESYEECTRTIREMNYTQNVSWTVAKAGDCVDLEVDTKEKLPPLRTPENRLCHLGICFSVENRTIIIIKGKLEDVPLSVTIKGTKGRRYRWSFFKDQPNFEVTEVTEQITEATTVSESPVFTTVRETPMLTTVFETPVPTTVTEAPLLTTVPAVPETCGRTITEMEVRNEYSWAMAKVGDCVNLSIDTEGKILIWNNPDQYACSMGICVKIEKRSVIHITGQLSALPFAVVIRDMKNDEKYRWQFVTESPPPEKDENETLPPQDESNTPDYIDNCRRIITSMYCTAVKCRKRVRRNDCVSVIKSFRSLIRKTTPSEDPKCDATKMICVWKLNGNTLKINGTLTRVPFKVKVKRSFSMGNFIFHFKRAHRRN